ALAVALTLALLVAFAVGKALQARRRAPASGQEELLGQRGVVRSALAPAGTVFVHGELWRAQAADGEPIPTGALVSVEGIEDDLVLQVRRADQPAAVA
ncbi:MAG: NfeD family protein, partial [Gaiellaceae bacterium]